MSKCKRINNIQNVTTSENDMSNIFLIRSVKVVLNTKREGKDEIESKNEKCNSKCKRQLKVSNVMMGIPKTKVGGQINSSCEGRKSKYKGYMNSTIKGTLTSEVKKGIKQNGRHLKKHKRFGCFQTMVSKKMKIER